MALYSNNSFFTGDLDGKNLSTMDKLDRTVKSLEERKTNVLDQLNNSNYFLDYIENFYKVNLNSGDATSENVNVFKKLESFASYILACQESIDMDKAEQKTYVFHNQNMQKYLDREKVDVANNESNDNIVDAENIVHALLARPKNSRRQKIQEVKNKDLERDDLTGEILREYKMLLDTINERLSEPQNSKWPLYTKHKFLVKQDMIDVKNMLDGVWGYNIQAKETHVPDLDVFDFTDMETVKYMMQYGKPDLNFNEDMWCVWQDFIKVVKQANLTPQELDIFSKLQNGWQLTEIAEELNIVYERLRQTIVKNIAKKITKVGCKYDAEDIRVKQKIENRKK